MPQKIYFTALIFSKSLTKFSHNMCFFRGLLPKEKHPAVADNILNTTKIICRFPKSSFGKFLRDVRFTKSLFLKTIDKGVWSWVNSWLGFDRRLEPRTRFSTSERSSVLEKFNWHLK